MKDTSEILKAELIKTLEDIERTRLETAKLKKELRWYEVTLIIAGTLAVVAIAKLFV